MRVNRAGLFWKDGGRGSSVGFGNARSRGAYFVDNDQDSSGGEIEGKFDLGHGWVAGVKFGLDTKVASSNFVSQFDNAWMKMNELQVKEYSGEIGHEKFGKIRVGLSDSASDGTSDINLAGSNVLADAEVNNWNDSFFLRVAGVGLTPFRWGDFFAGPNVGETGRFLTYISPKWNGFEVAVSVGQPMDIFLVLNPPKPFPGTETPEFGLNTPTVITKQGGVQTDIGIKYTGIWANQFLVKAGFGAFRDNTEAPDDRGVLPPGDPIERTEDTGVGGSFAIRHIATGLNIAVNSAALFDTKKCLEPGVVTGRCRGPDKFVYVKGGVVRKFNSWGPTAFYGEYYRGWMRQNSSEDDLLRALEVNLDEAWELQKSVQNVWGFGVVQTIEPFSARTHTTDVYVGYRNYSLDLSLIGEAGAAVPTRAINNWSAVMAGVRMRWGKIEKDDDD